MNEKSNPPAMLNIINLRESAHLKADSLKFMMLT